MTAPADPQEVFSEDLWQGQWQWPAAILSDLHLGHPNSKLTDPQQLLPLMKDVKTFIFNGDTFEGISVSRRSHSKKLATELAKLCHSQGVRPVFLTGNHDPRGTNAHWLDLLGGRVLVTHGDGLHPDIAPWSPDRVALSAERQRLQPSDEYPATLADWMTLIKQSDAVINRYDPVKLNRVWATVHFLRHFLAKPYRVLFAMDYWRRVPKLAFDLRDRYRPQAQVVFIGHSHRPGVWRRKNLLIINTGSFQPLSWPWIAYLTPDDVRVFKTARENGSFRLGRLVHQQSLPTPTSA